jgi:phenylpropionate dioxygenase-like ring-hydroxylating dioxygenase large terminal subunit
MEKDSLVVNKDEEDSSTFDWDNAWYPLVPVEILDVEKPHKFTLLGQDIVVWNDGKRGEFGPKEKKKQQSSPRIGGEWRAFVDSCPHRQVPLSEGRVENDGTLLCSYHGWRFDGSHGRCVAVPQIDEPAASNIRSNPRSQCQTYPTQVVQGILYVWPNAHPDAALQAALTPITQNYPYDSPSNKDGNRNDKNHNNEVWLGNWNFRELPYSADYFIENVVDGAHVTVSHHNIVGSRYQTSIMNMETNRPVTKTGFQIAASTAVVNPTNTATTTIASISNTTYIAPGAVHIETPINDKGAKQILELLVSPSRPGFSYHCGRIIIIKDDSGAVPPLLRQFTLPLPKWLLHLTASFFLHQDALFLHHQERKLHDLGLYSTVGSSYTSSSKKDGNTSSNAAAATQYAKAVCAVGTDAGVLNYRKWLSHFSRNTGGRIPYRMRNPILPPADNRVVFDVYQGHTQHCRYCQTALSNLKKLRLASGIVATSIATLRPFGKMGSLVSTLLAAAVGLLVHKLIGLFYKFEFSHAYND